MKFTIEKDIIKKAVSVVKFSPRAKVVKINAVKGGGVKLGTVTLTSQYETVQTSYFFNCRVEEEGECSMCLSRLSSVIRTTLKGSLMEFSLERDELSIRLGKRVLTNKSLTDEDSFCTRSLDKEDIGFEANSQDFSQSLERISFAMSDIPERYNLCGVHFDFEEGASKGEISLVATNGHIASITKLNTLKNGLSIKGKLAKKEKLVSREGVLKLVRTLKSLKLPRGHDGCMCAFSKTLFSVEVGSVRVIVDLLDTTFPSYKDILKESLEPRTKTAIIVPLKQLSDEIKVICFCKKIENIEFSIVGTELLLRAFDNSEEYEGRTSVPCGYNGFCEDAKICFRVEYLCSILASLRRDKFGSILISFEGDHGGMATLLPQIGKDGGVYVRHVIMPIKNTDLLD